MPFELTPENIIVVLLCIAFMFGFFAWLMYSAKLDKQDIKAREAKEANKK